MQNCLALNIKPDKRRQLGFSEMHTKAKLVGINHVALATIVSDRRSANN